jgi:hypothetical protein
MQSYCYCLGFKRLIAVTCASSVGGLNLILNYVCLCVCGRLHSHSSVCILYKPCNFLNTFTDWMVFLMFWVFKMGLILGFSQNLMLSPLTFSSFQHCVHGYSNFIYLCNSMFIGCRRWGRVIVRVLLLITLDLQAQLNQFATDVLKILTCRLNRKALWGGG